MTRTLSILLALAALIGCATQSQTLDNRQSGATQAALERGRFDLDCPAATATVLSRDFIQPALQGPWMGGLQRAEYTVGVEGCGKRTTYVVLCQVGTSTCFAAHTGDRFQVPVGAGR